MTLLYLLIYLFTILLQYHTIYGRYIFTLQYMSQWARQAVTIIFIGGIIVFILVSATESSPEFQRFFFLVPANIFISSIVELHSYFILLPSHPASD